MKNNLSLTRMIEIIVLFSLFFFAVFLYIDIKNIVSTLDELQKDKVVSVIKAKNDTLASLLKYGFYDELKDELKKLSKRDSIDAIEIKSPKFEFVTSHNGDEEISMPILFKNSQIGTIRVYYDDKKLIKEFFEKYFSKFVIYLGIFLVFFLSMAMYTINKIRKLSLLALKLQKINFKKTSKIEPLDNYLEIKIITEAINKLLFQVYTFYYKQKNLLKRISLYRRELETAQMIVEMFSWQYSFHDNKFHSKNFRSFKNKFKKDINEFMNSFKEKELFFKKIEEVYKNKSEFSFIGKIEMNGQNFYFKTEAKYTFKDVPMLIGATIDITDEIQKQKQIEYLAYHDSLTGLKNRTFLKDKLEDLIEEKKESNKKIAFIFLDLDNFKFVNDTFGHDVGDTLLIELSKIINLNEYHKTALRLGGDEFLIVLYDVNSKEDIIEFVEYIRNSILTLKKINNKFAGITFSIGISIFPDDSRNLDELIKFADIAMYEAKKGGKNRYYFIQDDMKEEIENFYLTLNNLKEALKKEDELLLFYQPKINIEYNRVEGVEALIRWNFDGKVLSPFAFIPYSEKGGIITKIDSYVLNYAIKTLSRWKDDEVLKHMKMAINISGYKFREVNFLDEIVGLLEKYKVNPNKLEIELTETVSIENLKYTQKVLNSLRDLGITIAIDDFGTGYSSLNYLKEIPFDVLKIDQSFIRNLENRDELEITKMIVGISKMLNKKNVAEGVENKDILNIVKGLGVDIVQGYYFSKPLREEELKEFIKSF